MKEYQQLCLFCNLLSRRVSRKNAVRRKAVIFGQKNVRQKSPQWRNQYGQPKFQSHSSESRDCCQGPQGKCQPSNRLFLAGNLPLSRYNLTIFTLEDLSRIPEFSFSLTVSYSSHETCAQLIHLTDSPPFEATKTLSYAGALGWCLQLGWDGSFLFVVTFYEDFIN